MLLAYLVKTVRAFHIISQRCRDVELLYVFAASCSVLYKSNKIAFKRTDSQIHFKAINMSIYFLQNKISLNDRK